MEVTPLPKRLTQLSEISTLIMKEGTACFKENIFVQSRAVAAPRVPQHSYSMSSLKRFNLVITTITTTCL